MGEVRGRLFMTQSGEHGSPGLGNGEYVFERRWWCREVGWAFWSGVVAAATRGRHDMRLASIGANIGNAGQASMVLLGVPSIKSIRG